MSLQAKLDAFKADLRAGKLPYSISSTEQETMDRATEALIASNAAALALKAGDSAPDFTLPAADGTMVASSALLAKGPLIVSFYRGVWCPYCTMELQALQQALPAYRAAGATLIALSPQNRLNSRKAMRDNGLDFPILSDAGGAVAAAFGVRFALPDDLVALYQARNNDLSVFNGDESWTLPMPSRFVIAPDGIIRYAEVNPDYTRRPDPLELLPSLRVLCR